MFLGHVRRIWCIFWFLRLFRMEVLRERTGQRSRVEMSAGPLYVPTSGFGPDQMGMPGVDGDERCVGSRRHPRQLRRLQQSVHGVWPLSVVVVDAPVAGHILAAGLCDVLDSSVVSLKISIQTLS